MFITAFVRVIVFAEDVQFLKVHWQSNKYGHTS